ncbi:helix-turn-helix transcriptional regulator [Dictyobacter alpinus]|uniref:Helix-turn-helix transcriptional regulator n=1 Tax=Dictyobacter alpinus TaxID=2014873 RepID=A0A402BGZ9_9CHLR|nr:LuxR C-terminal-related transcriptional regulator [Dictyobacter alpinus]GCE30512.1 helix-turn-helix transcriptional regulator [Dictyobacter alpinus]
MSRRSTHNQHAASQTSSTQHIAGMDTQSMTLVQTKLQLPHLPLRTIKRDQLWKHLDASMDYKISLVSTPAGFGKTTLVSQWITARNATTAWVTLDTDDNDPLRFWRYLIAACQRFLPESEATALSLSLLSPTIATPFTFPTLENVVTSLLNELMQLNQQAILVLDDYAVITENIIHKTLTTFLERLPPAIHVILISRSEPPLPLLRWRARGEIYDLNTTDLRFSREEIATFFEQELTLSLSVQALQHLDTLLEGWAAGLRLIALNLRNKHSVQEVEQYILNLSAEQRSIQAYFVDEILASQPEAAQSFLLQTSILSRLSASLVDDVMDRSDSATLITSLELAGLFIEVLDIPTEVERWYRYSSLFTEVLQHEARHRLGEDTLKKLASKASQWFEEHNMHIQAVEMALQAQDGERVAQLMEESILTTHSNTSEKIYTATDFHDFCRCLELLPEEVLARHPHLCFSYANARLYTYVLGEVPLTAENMQRLERCLDMAEASWRSSNNTIHLGEVLAFRALITQQYGYMEKALQLAKQALDYLPIEQSQWYMACRGVLGAGLISTGQLHEARQLFQHRMSINNRAFTRPGVILFSKICIEQAEFRQATASLEQILIEAREDKDRDDIADAQLGLAKISYAQNALATAQQQAQEALELARQLVHEEAIIHAEMVLVAIQHAHGTTVAALQQLMHKLAWVKPNGIPMRSQFFYEILAAQAQLQLASGDLVAVERWVQSRKDYAESLPRVQQEKEEFLMARWFISQKQAQDALELLTPILDAAKQAGRIRNSLECQLMMAQAHAMLKQQQTARSLLLEVVAHAGPENYQRLFLDQGPAMVALLQALLPHIQATHQSVFVKKVLRAFSNPGSINNTSSSVLIEALSPQEQRVLRLLVSGRKNPEIAAELVVSTNTVKTHIQNIYRKLNVENRVEASEVARQLNLLQEFS